MEKSYRVVGNTGHWAVAEDGAEPAGDYATREGALEVIYLAASNDIKSGHGVTIKSNRRHRMHLRLAGKSKARNFCATPIREAGGIRSKNSLSTIPSISDRRPAWRSRRTIKTDFLKT